MSRRGPVSGRSSLWVLDLRSTSKYVTTLVGFTGLSDAVHTVRIDVVGTRTGAGSAVGIDYLRIT